MYFPSTSLWRSRCESRPWIHSNVCWADKAKQQTPNAAPTRRASECEPCQIVIVAGKWIMGAGMFPWWWEEKRRGGSVERLCVWAATAPKPSKNHNRDEKWTEGSHRGAVMQFPFFSSFIKISSSRVSNFHHRYTESHSCLFLGHGYHHKCTEQDNNMCQEKTKNKNMLCCVKWRLSNIEFVAAR